MIKTNEVQKILDKYNKNEPYPIRYDEFVNDAKRYIKAIKQGRMLCNIESVSSSGMSRVVKFFEMSRNKYNGEYQPLNFWRLFGLLGYSPAGKYKDGFRINGCGMDMVFATNYDIIHQLHRLGFINKKQCSELAQKTPHVI